MQMNVDQLCDFPCNFSLTARHVQNMQNGEPKMAGVRIMA